MTLSNLHTVTAVTLHQYSFGSKSFSGSNQLRTTRLLGEQELRCEQWQFLIFGGNKNKQIISALSII
jgi:hypothetical protein